MEIIIGTREEITNQAAQHYVDLLKDKPNSVLGFATGSTPLDLYKKLTELYREGKISFRDVTAFNLDEYVGFDGTEKQSYRFFMRENFFNKIDINIKNTYIPSGIDLEKACEYDKKIDAAGGIDIQLLSLGVDGHIGFNEPYTPFGSRTHIVDLFEETRRINSRFFDSINDVPKQAITMGIRSVMNARKIVFIAMGSVKAGAIRKMMYGKVTEEFPASVLQLHPNIVVYLDEEAAALL